MPILPYLSGLAAFALLLAVVAVDAWATRRRAANAAPRVVSSPAPAAAR